MPLVNLLPAIDDRRFDDIVKEARTRIARYTPDLLDQLCLSGEVMWGRLSPHPAFETGEPRRVRPTGRSHRLGQMRLEERLPQPLARPICER